MRTHPPNLRLRVLPALLFAGLAITACSSACDFFKSPAGAQTAVEAVTFTAHEIECVLENADKSDAEIFAACFPKLASADAETKANTTAAARHIVSVHQAKALREFGKDASPK